MLYAWKGYTGHRWVPSQKDLWWYFFVVSLNNLLNKESRCSRFETLQRSCDLTLIINELVYFDWRASNRVHLDKQLQPANRYYVGFFLVFWGFFLCAGEITEYFGGVYQVRNSFCLVAIYINALSYYVKLHVLYTNINGVLAKPPLVIWHYCVTAFLRWSFT